MDPVQSDEQLIFMLDEAAAWTVNDHHGKVLHFAASLRAALHEASAYLAVLHGELTVCRHPGDKIVVQGEQLRRLVNAIETPRP